MIVIVLPTPRVMVVPNVVVLVCRCPHRNRHAQPYYQRENSCKYLFAFAHLDLPPYQFNAQAQFRLRYASAVRASLK
jgi:hypothetical protein